MHYAPNGQIPGWGADARREDRPGVPMELEPPRPVGNPPYRDPSLQTEGNPTAKDAERPLTPVYGTAVPLRGLSGVIRRVAYKVPVHKPRRWMMLMMADRIDVIEHNIVPIAAIAGVAVLGAFALRAYRRS